MRNLAKPVPVCDYNTMRKQFKEKFWKLEDAKAPSRQYIEQQLEKAEKSDWRAERLTEVVADKEDNKDGMMPVFDIMGVFKSENEINCADAGEFRGVEVAPPADGGVVGVCGFSTNGQHLLGEGGGRGPDCVRPLR